MEHEDGTDALETIIKIAGRREPVDPQRTERVERNAYARWQSMLVARRTAQRRRRAAQLAGIALVASIGGLAILLPRPAPEMPVVATLTRLIGSPSLASRGHPMTALENGMAMRAGSVLETAADDGAALALNSGHTLRVAGASRLRLEAGAVVLDAGSVYIDSGDARRAAPIEVRSTFGIVSELGTRYVVRVSNDALQVSVRDGAVNVTQGDRVSAARAGEMLTVDHSGIRQRSAIASYGEPWSIFSALAAVPKLEGLTLREFLQWLAHEYGWQVDYASAEIERDAATVELHGSIDGLSGEDALAAVMTSSGWQYSLTDGRLHVRKP